MRFTGRLLRAPAGALIVALGFMSATAFANGRFPEAQRIFEYPGNPDRLYLSATFGLMVTEDRGKNWYTICEDAFALQFVEGDPLFEIMPDGTLLGGIYASLNRSTDCGCTWQATLASSSTDYVVDIAIDRSTKAVLALVQDASTLPARYGIFESTDLGKTWSKRSDLPSEMAVAQTLDVAPSDSKRVYVSGGPRTAAGTLPKDLLAVSNDHGKTWQLREISLTDTNAGPYIAAVDPSNPDRLYVRTDEWDDSAYFAANDALLYSEDAGQTWRELVRHQAKLFGFALSPDNKTLLVGYGDPVQAGGRTTNSDDFGLYKASVTAFNFEKIFSAAINGLTWTSTGVYVSITENNPDVPTPGMSLGFSATANFTLSTPTPLVSLLAVKKVKGPLACNVGLCADNWKTGMMDVAPLCDLLQASCAGDLTTNSLSCSASGAAGAGGSSAGSGGSGAGGGGAGGGPGGHLPTGTDTGTGGGGGKSGCGCAAVPKDGPERLGVLAIALVALFALSRRRRARGPVDTVFGRGPR